MKVPISGVSGAGFVHHQALGVESVFLAHAARLFPGDIWKALQEPVHPGERTIDLRARRGADRRARLDTRDLDQLVAIGLKHGAILLHQFEAHFPRL
jgi:hypothetical protein